MPSDQPPVGAVDPIAALPSASGVTVRPLIGEYPERAEPAPRPQRSKPRLVYVGGDRTGAGAVFGGTAQSPDSSALRDILKALVNAGTLPLSGEASLEYFIINYGEKLASALNDFIRRQDTPLNPRNLLSVGISLSKILRLFPQLRERLFYFEAWLCEAAKSSEFNGYIEETLDEDQSKYLRRLVLELDHLHAVGRSLFVKSRIALPSREAALSLDLPNLAINITSLEVLNLCASDAFDAALNTYQKQGILLERKYVHYPTARIANSLCREENADLNVLTCLGNMYSSFAKAHLICASLEYGSTKAAHIKWSRKFMERAKDSFCKVRPTWSHGLATLHVIRWAEQQTIGNSVEAQYFWQLAHDQLRFCNDIRGAMRLKDFDENDPSSISDLLIR